MKIGDKHKTSSRKIFRYVLIITLISFVMKSTLCTTKQINAVKKLVGHEQFIKYFGEKFIEALNKKHLKKMNKYYTYHCGHLDPENLTYDHKRLQKEDKKLAEFLNFTRSDPYKIPLEKARITDILSLWGWIIFLLPIFFMGTSVISLVFTCMFFYFPKTNNTFLKYLLGKDNDFEIIDDDKVPIEQMEYYKFTKNKVSKQKSLFKLFIFKFCLSIGMMLSLLFGLGMVINFDTSADCGITKAALNILEGKDGNYFTEFGLLSNKSLLHKFREDLENFKHHDHLDYDKIIELNPMNKAFLLQESFISWHSSLKNQKVTKCTKGTGEYIHPLVQKFEPFVNREVRGEIMDAVAYATHLSEGATELKLLKMDKDKRIKQFMNYSEQLGKEIDEINIDFKAIYDSVEGFFKNYYTLLAAMALSSFSWFIYSFTMLIPSKSNEAALFSKSCGVVFLTLGASIFSILGSILFLKSQVLISNCHRAVRLLDHPNMIQQLYGNADKEWARICLAEGGSGDISMFLKNPKHITEFKKPMSIIRAFSSKLTSVNHSMSEYDPPSMIRYSLVVEAYKKYELPDDIGNRNGGYTDALSTINMYTIPKYGDRYVLNEVACQKSDTVKVNNLEQYHLKVSNQIGVKNHNCVLLNKISDIKDLKPNLRYDDEKFAEMIQRFLGHLATCKPKLDEFLDKWSDNLLASRIRTHIMYDTFKQTNQTVSKIKAQFNKSIIEYIKDDKKIDKMLDCSVLREEVMSAIGSACYQKTYTYGAFLTSLCFMLASLLSMLLAMISFMEIMVDKTVIRKYQELEQRANITSIDVEDSKIIEMV